MRFFIWLDDIRDIDNKWKEKCKEYGVNIIICRSYKDFLDFLKYCDIGHKKKLFISFDHDLGSDKIGYDVARYIVEHQVDIAGFRIHSMNPVGAKNIRHLLTHYGYKELKVDFL